MPYNPGSAYPRKTVYVPPTYGDTSFQRAVNAPDVSSSGSVGGITLSSRGRGAYAEAASAAANASNASDLSGMAAARREGIVGMLQNRYMEQRGLKQNTGFGGTTFEDTRPHKPDEVKTPAEMAAGKRVVSSAPTHGNPAAMEKRAAATQLADEMVDGVTTGDMPGDTGMANTKKSRKKTNPNQTTLF